MAQRPIFIPDPNRLPYVMEWIIDFEWHPGFSVSQAQRSVRSLHDAASKQGISPMLEISSKSTEPLGVSLSAFNLRFTVNDGKVLSVESAFQGSKVFERGGPFTDLYDKLSRDAKTDPRLRNSGDVIDFNLMGDSFPTKPVTAFYDWLYIRALLENSNLAVQLLNYKGFSDIAFNPEKSINCQARSAAQYVALIGKPNIDLDRIAKDKDYYMRLITESDADEPEQLSFEM